MIDHTETWRRYRISSPFRARDKLIVQCEDCLQRRSICCRVYNKIIKQDNLTLCASCRTRRNRSKYKDVYAKSDKKRSESLSKTYKSKWQDKRYKDKQLASLRSDDCRNKHSTITRSLWSDQQYRTLVQDKKKKAENTAAHKTKMRIIYDSDDYREKLRKNWRNNDYREKVLAIWTDENFRKMFADEARSRTRELWSDPVYREKMLNIANSNKAMMKEIFADEDLRNHISKAVTAVWGDDGYRQKVTETSRKLWQDDEYRIKVMTILRSDAIKHKMSEASKSRWQDPAYCEKMAVARSLMPRISKPQKMLYEILGNLGVEYYEEGPRTQLGFYSFDCLVPKQGMMTKNLLIEVHGEYFHNRDQQKGRDLAKLSYIDRYFPDYEVRVVWEQWFLFRDKVIRCVREWLGNTDVREQIAFNLRDVNLRAIDYKVCVDFLSRYHYLYTCPRGSIRFGAYLGENLIAVCLFSPLVRQNIVQSISSDLKHTDAVELSRFCIHPCYHKKNFASWMISRCIKGLDFKVIVAYSDRTVGHSGTIYKAAGFEQDRIVKPDYWYMDDDGYVVHKRTLYGRACKMSMLESEYANKYNYRKVMGDSKLRYIFRIKHTPGGT